MLTRSLCIRELFCLGTYILNSNMDNSDFRTCWGGRGGFGRTSGNNWKQRSYQTGGCSQNTVHVQGIQGE